MQRKFVCKRVYVILLGAALLCLFSSCASIDEDANYETEGNVIESSSVNELGKGNQLSEASNEQPQASPDVSSEQPQASPDVSSEQPQVSPDVNSEQAQVSIDEDRAQSNNISNEQVESSFLSIEESYRAILLGNGHFISTDLQNKELSLQDIGEAVTDDDSITVKATQFTIIDLDDDGESEIVLWIQINGISDYGFEILHYQKGVVYGYTLPYRTFMNLKTDGTFLFSGGVADSGIGKLKLSEDEYAIENIIGEVDLEEEINAAMSWQESKVDVVWHDLSVDSVNIAFEDKF